jgi:hypothetical protein
VGALFEHFLEHALDDLEGMFAAADFELALDSEFEKGNAHRAVPGRLPMLLDAAGELVLRSGNLCPSPGRKAGNTMCASCAT